MNVTGNQLISVALYERAPEGSILLAWAYPQLDEEDEAIVSHRIPWSPLGRASANPFVFSRRGATWHYMATFSADRSVTTEIESFALVVCSRIFHPERFAALLKVLGERYWSSGDPLQVLDVYLSVFTTGHYDGPGGGFNAADFTEGQALLGPRSIKAVIQEFGVEAALLWNALLQKKRVVVVCGSSLSALLATVRALPQLMWARQNWSILRPFVTMSEPELAELRAAGVYVAGFMDPAIAERTDLYDLLVDLDNNAITVPTHAKEDLRMGSLHKDVAALMVAAAEERTDQEVIKAVAIKTLEVVKQLRASFGGGSARELIERVEASDIPVTMRRFVVNVGLAEGFTSQ